MDPLAVMRGFAVGLNGKREQVLMLVREASKHGKVQSYGNVADLGLFLYYTWRRGCAVWV